MVSVNDLVKNLTEWLNSKSNKQLFVKKDFNLYDTISSVVNLYRLRAEDKEIYLRMVVDKDLNAYGEERMIKTIVRNFVDNAIKFTANGGIEIKAWELEDKVFVSVTDTGMGIKDENKEKIMNLDTHVSTIGTKHEIGGGLGLMLSKEFIAMNDGQIWFESEVGKGSTFSFNIQKNNLN